LLRDASPDRRAAPDSLLLFESLPIGAFDFAEKNGPAGVIIESEDFFRYANIAV
jgi:hypothetical protein